MAEVAAAVRVCLSRPAVSKANDLPWNLDNLSARLQSRERERETCTCSKSRYVPSLFRFLSLFCNLCPTYIHPSVSFQTAPLPTAPRVSRPFTYRSPMQRGMNGTRRVEGVSPTTSPLSLSLSLFEREWCRHLRAETRKNFRSRRRRIFVERRRGFSFYFRRGFDYSNSGYLKEIVYIYYSRV